MHNKLNLYINKLEMILGRKKIVSLPRHVQLEPTNLCNQRCIFCPRNTHMDAALGVMTFENFKKVYKQIPNIGDLQLNGLGEPLLNKEIFKMIQYANDKGSNVTLTSNCELMTEEKAEKLVKSGLNLLKISMDTIDPEVYSKIRKGNLDKALAGIKRVVAAKKKLGSRRPIIWFNSIIMKDNYKNMLDIVKLGSDLGIDSVRFKPINVFDIYEENNLLVPKEELFKYIEQTSKASKDYKVNHNLEKLLVEKHSYYRPKNSKCPCYAPWLEVYIQWYGGIRLCCEFYETKYDLGNIFEEDFSKIWNSRKFQKIRSIFIQGEMDFPVCKNCNRFKRNLVIYDKIKKYKFFKKS